MQTKDFAAKSKCAKDIVVAANDRKATATNCDFIAGASGPTVEIVAAMSRHTALGWDNCTGVGCGSCSLHQLSPGCTTVALITIWSQTVTTLALNLYVIILSLCWVEPGRWRGLVTPRAGLA